MRKYHLFHDDIPEDIEISGDIAIDTEALGLNLRRDRLCLVQMADSQGNEFLVKYNSSDFNSPNLVKLLSDESRTKIFHYARFDVAILMYSLKMEKIPNIFCTKIASKLTRTYTEFHGLKTICRELLSAELDKESQSSNWSAKTLTEKQIQYALNDVRHLHKLRDTFTHLLQDRGRNELAKECFDFIHTVCKMDIAGFDISSILNH